MTRDPINAAFARKWAELSRRVSLPNGVPVTGATQTMCPFGRVAPASPASLE